MPKCVLFIVTNITPLYGQLSCTDLYCFFKQQIWISVPVHTAIKNSIFLWISVPINAHFGGFDSGILLWSKLPRWQNWGWQESKQGLMDILRLCFLTCILMGNVWFGCCHYSPKKTPHKTLFHIPGRCYTTTLQTTWHLRREEVCNAKGIYGCRYQIPFMSASIYCITSDISNYMTFVLVVYAELTDYLRPICSASTYVTLCCYFLVHMFVDNWHIEKCR